MPSDELCKLHKNPSFICECNVVHYDAFITRARRESKRVREKEKKDLQTKIHAFSSKTKRY
jgi:hypothetical protein